MAAHGSPYDRGASDSYYRRAERPHKWLDKQGRNEVTDLTVEEVAEYRRGYADNEAAGDHKDWS